MKAAVEAVLRDYGQTVTVTHAGQSTQVRAFLQPVTSKSWQNMEHVFSGLGRVERGQYLYLGPAAQPLEQGDLLQSGGTWYVVRKAEQIAVADVGLYRWGMCVRKGGDDPWSS